MIKLYSISEADNFNKNITKVGRLSEADYTINMFKLLYMDRYYTKDAPEDYMEALTSVVDVGDVMNIIRHNYFCVKAKVVGLGIMDGIGYEYSEAT